MVKTQLLSSPHHFNGSRRRLLPCGPMLQSMSKPVGGLQLLTSPHATNLAPMPHHFLQVFIDGFRERVRRMHFMNGFVNSACLARCWGWRTWKAIPLAWRWEKGGFEDGFIKRRVTIASLNFFFRRRYRHSKKLIKNGREECYRMENVPGHYRVQRTFNGYFRVKPHIFL